jgi:hypothetical protein
MPYPPGPPGLLEALWPLALAYAALQILSASRIGVAVRDEVALRPVCIRLDALRQAVGVVLLLTAALWMRGAPPGLS